MQNHEETGGEGAPEDTGEQSVEALHEQLADAETRLADMQDTLLRERAELENQRRRLQRDVEQSRRFANEKLLKDLLPVLDSLERGLAAEATDIESVRAGIELTLRELLRVVRTAGLEPVGMEGEAFNPDHHEAMKMVPAGEHAPGHVATVMQKGYLLNERLLRPALVFVTGDGS